MEIEIFTLCDYAQDYVGKLTVVGTFDVIMAANFPAIHPTCSIAGRLRFSEKEVGIHGFKLKLINEKGDDLIQAIEGDIEVKKPEIGNHSAVNFSLNLFQLKFDNPGKYSFELYMDGEWRSGFSLNVIQQK